MTMVEIPGGMYIPNPPVLGTGGAPGLATSITLNASGDRTGWVFQCPKAGTLDKFEFFLTTLGQATNGITLSFQGIDPTTGFPDTVVDQFRVVLQASLSSGLWVVPGLMTDDGTDTGVKRVVTQGEWLGCVVDFTSFAGGDSIAITPGWNLVNTDQLLNYIANGSTGAYAKNNTFGIIALKYDDGTYAVFPLFLNIPSNGAALTRTFNSGDTPDERAMKFTVPWDCRINGGWIRLDIDAVCDIVLYDNAAGVLTSVSLDPDIRSVTTGQNCPFIFATSIDLNAGDEYYLAVKPGASDVSVYDIGVTANALIGAMPGGSGWIAATRTDAGAWTTVATTRPVYGIHLSHIDVPAGGGSESSHAFIGMMT